MWHYRADEQEKTFYWYDLENTCLQHFSVTSKPLENYKSSGRKKKSFSSLGTALFWLSCWKNITETKKHKKETECSVARAVNFKVHQRLLKQPVFWSKTFLLAATKSCPSSFCHPIRSTWYLYSLRSFSSFLTQNYLCINIYIIYTYMYSKTSGKRHRGWPAGERLMCRLVGGLRFSASFPPTIPAFHNGLLSSSSHKQPATHWFSERIWGCGGTLPGTVKTSFACPKNQAAVLGRHFSPKHSARRLSKFL